MDSEMFDKVKRNKLKEVLVLYGVDEDFSVLFSFCKGSTSCMRANLALMQVGCYEVYVGIC